MAVYRHLDELGKLLEKRLVTRRRHPELPLSIYNYTIAAQFTPIPDWTPALSDCRGLILDDSGELVARPFKKFWNYEQVLDRVPSGEPFTVWEKVDGSLGIAFEYEGRTVVSTRGDFTSDQSKWAAGHLGAWKPPLPGLTYLFEIVYPENRIVVDYGDARGMFLLAVLDAEGRDRDEVFELVHGFPKAKRYDGLSLETLERLEALPEHAGREGFVVRWESGFRAKVKFAEYKRLHRLITQCSTRTIWELLRYGKDTAELIDRVPADFRAWVEGQISGLRAQHAELVQWAHTTMTQAPQGSDRKAFAEFAKQQKHSNPLFSLLDGRSVDDLVWRLVEPKWAQPYKTEGE